MTYILIGLCKYPHGPAVGRAWIVLNEVFSHSNKEDLADISGLTDARKESTRNFKRQPLLRLLAREGATCKEARITGDPPHEFFE